MADRIAERGYAVLAPNLLYRGGRAPQFDLSGLDDPDRRAELVGRIMPFVAGLDHDKLVSDAGSYLDFLTAQDGVAAGSVVLVGYCMGGMNALLTSRRIRSGSRRSPVSTAAGWPPISRIART
jgi:carboxymethylenebutenolidase